MIPLLVVMCNTQTRFRAGTIGILAESVSATVGETAEYLDWYEPGTRGNPSCYISYMRPVVATANAPMGQGSAEFVAVELDAPPGHREEAPCVGTLLE